MGYLSSKSIRLAVGVVTANVPQCSCETHEHLKDDDLTEAESDDFKTMVCTPLRLTADSGANYACALLRRLFSYMGLNHIKANRSGDKFSVSYRLEWMGKQYFVAGLILFSSKQT